MATVNNNDNSLLETLYNEEIKLGKIPSGCDKRFLESCIFLVFLILPGVSRSRVRGFGLLMLFISVGDCLCLYLISDSYL